MTSLVAAVSRKLSLLDFSGNGYESWLIGLQNTKYACACIYRPRQKALPRLREFSVRRGLTKVFSKTEKSIPDIFIQYSEGTFIVAAIPFELNLRLNRTRRYLRSQDHQIMHGALSPGANLTPVGESHVPSYGIHRRIDYRCLTPHFLPLTGRRFLTQLVGSSTGPLAICTESVSKLPAVFTCEIRTHILLLNSFV